MKIKLFIFLLLLSGIVAKAETSTQDSTAEKKDGSKKDDLSVPAFKQGHILIGASLGLGFAYTNQVEDEETSSSSSFKVYIAPRIGVMIAKNLALGALLIPTTYQQESFGDPVEENILLYGGFARLYFEDGPKRKVYIESEYAWGTKEYSFYNHSPVAGPTPAVYDVKARASEFSVGGGLCWALSRQLFFESSINISVKDDSIDALIFLEARTGLAFVF